MIDMPLSMFAWLIVVLLQFVVHYLVIGRRRRKRGSDEIKAENQNHSEMSNASDVQDGSGTAEDQDIPENDSFVEQDDELDDFSGCSSVNEDDIDDMDFHRSLDAALKDETNARLCHSPTTVAANHDDLRRSPNPAGDDDDDDDNWSLQIDEKDLDNDQWQNQILRNYYSSCLPQIPNIDETQESNPRRPTVTFSSGSPLNVRVSSNKEVKKQKRDTFVNESIVHNRTETLKRPVKSSLSSTCTTSRDKKPENNNRKVVSFDHDCAGLVNVH